MEEQIKEVIVEEEETVVISAEPEISWEEAERPAPQEDPFAEEDEDLTAVVGVRFRTAGKSYYFGVGDLPVRRGSHVIVETARGQEYGTSVCDPMKIHQKRFKAPIKKIIRMATAADERRIAENKEKEREAYRICFEKIRRHNLDMKLIDAEYTFDNSKILFYFTSDGRVDFRDLVKDLAGVFHTRIELRQIGVRDETKILGGYGICGRPLCCHTYLSDFVPVSIKMAKEQNLSLNPTKISGACGRLMCCLKNEEETYEALNKNLPRLGDEVEMADGLTGEVAGVNILKQTVRVLVEVNDEKELHECGADEITILRRRKRGQAKPKINRTELKNSGNASRGNARKEVAAAKPEAKDSEKEEKAEGGRQAERVEGETKAPERGPRERRDRRPRGRQEERNRQDRRPQEHKELKEPRESGEHPEGERPEADGYNRRRHRYRRRTGSNDRRREEKPAQTE